MNLINLIELRLLIEEIFNVASLTGNAGKTVKRLIDRTFVPGLSLDLSKEAGRHSPLGFALYLQQLQILVEGLRATEVFDGFINIKLVPKLSEGLGYVSVLLTATNVPEGMRDRQALLREGRDLLQNFEYFGNQHLCDYTESFFSRYTEERCKSSVDEEVILRKELLKIFGEFVSGDTTRAHEETELYELAQLLNPSLPDLTTALAA